MYMKNLFSSWICLLVTAITLICVPALGQSKIEVVDKYFYAEFTINGETGSRFKTFRVPNLPDKVCFGWVINIKPNNDLVKITEIFTLPAAPEEWGGVDDNSYSATKTSDDGKTATTNRFISLKSGVIENSWCLSEGDQSGLHHIVVLNDQQVLAEFEFEVYDR